MARHRLLGACALAALALHACNASAQDSNCLLDIGDVVVNGDIQIATSCELTGTEVRGSVTLFSGGSLIARNVRIKGDLVGHRADFVDMERSRVDGSLRLEELVGDVSRFELTDIRGDLLLASNRSSLEILNNEIEGDLQATGNTGGVLVAGNSINDDLKCSGNTPVPVGIGNRVDGKSEGQCKNLRPAAPTSAPPPSPPAAPPPPPPLVAAPSTPAPPATPAPSGSTPPPTDTLEPADDGAGAGAMGWSALLLLPLLVWRRFARNAPGRRERRAH